MRDPGQSTCSSRWLNASSKRCCLMHRRSRRCRSLDGRRPARPADARRRRLERNSRGEARAQGAFAQRTTAPPAEVARGGLEMSAAHPRSGGGGMACCLGVGRVARGPLLLLDPDSRCDCAERGHHGEPLLFALLLRLQETHRVASFSSRKPAASPAALQAEYISSHLSGVAPDRGRPKPVTSVGLWPPGCAIGCGRRARSPRRRARLPGPRQRRPQAARRRAGQMASHRARR